MSTCWPGRCDCQPGTSRVSVRTRAVSSRRAVTVATCQFRAAIRRARSGCPSIAAVALFKPRVAAIVVAETFPEAWLVALEQAQAAHPLGALPEIQMGHDQPRRPAMLGRQRTAV